VFFIGWGSENGVVAGGVEAENDFGSWGKFQAQALGANGNATIGADLDGGPNAPNIRPPRATRGWAQHGTFFFFGQIPGPLRSKTQFAVSFVSVTMEAQSLDMGIGLGQLGDAFTGKVGRETFLPELMFALDFAFGLGGGSIKETNVIKLERPAQLSESVRGFSEKEAVIIHVELKRSPVGQEGRGQEIEVGQEQLAVVKFGADEEAGAIIEHIEHGIVDRGVWKPGMRRGVQLPKFAGLRTLPATDGRMGPLGRCGMGVVMLDRPATNLGAIQLERVKAQGFGSDKAIGTRG